IFGWIGFRKKWLEFENVERSVGETKWSFWKLFVYAIDGIIAFSTAPLVIASVLGVLLCIVAFVFILFIIARTLIFGDPTSGWPSMVCVILFVSGIQLLCMGILGQYLAKTYLETKNRPKYLVQDDNVN
ncbi:MAG: glycosyltransferase, partial [Clostridia bacterium]|nr:glycosyltransferase [Clostridia bacterium]